MIQAGKIIALDDAGGRISLTISSENTQIEDVTLCRISRDEHQVSVGDAVFLFPLDGPDGEFVALPIVQAVALGARLVIGSSVILAETPGNAVALALFSEVKTLRDELTLHTHTVAPSGTTGPGPVLSIPVGTQVVKAE